ncbi:MAG: SpvB/TcaC N-terminal domain-containing protein [Chitinophagaceae bacterium]
MPTDQNTNQQSSGGNKHPLDRYTVHPQQSGGDGQEKSPYYKSQAPSISLPKGGGALKGIDEKFNVNAVNGTAGLEVPFPLTPGRGGFTPSLSISYNSGAGNSEFGMGWGMSLPSIQRKTDKRLPQYNDVQESDVFLLAGAEDLVPKLDEFGVPVEHIEDVIYLVKEYVPRIEGLFARIEFIKRTDTGDCWWRVATKDNILTYYGLTNASRIADPEAPSRIFKWLPEMVLDHKGNVQQYFYVAEDIVNIVKGAHETNHLNNIAPFTNTYLKSVGYCNLEPFFITTDFYEPALPSVTYLMESVLDFGDHDSADPVYTPSQNWDGRMDAFSDFHAGFEIRTFRRCRRVLMFHRFRELNGGASLDPVLVRSLDLSYYQDQTPNNPALPNDHAGIDYILTITQSGYYYDGSSNLIKKSLPPITVDYQAIEWDYTIHDVAREDWANAPQGLTGNYQWTDFFGEGLPGILSEQGNAWWYKRNLGDGHFTHAVSLAPKPSFVGLGSSIQWQDLEADGRRQVVTYDTSLPGYFEASLPKESDIDGIQEWEAFRTFQENINIDWNSPFNKMLDLDGDGRPDLLLCEDRVFTWYKNKGKEGFGLGGYASVSLDEDKGPRLLLNDQVQSVYLADLNGDGLTDLVRIRNGEVCYWPNKGYGRFGAKVTMDNSPTFDHPDTFNPQYIYISDISGTGAADILYLAQSKCIAYINRSGNSFSNGVDIATLPGIDPYSKVSVIDFLGNGTGCIVWSSPLPQYANAPLRYIDLMGGKKPHLMKTYSNGMGKSVSLKYKSSTKYYLADRLAGTPWITKLPFPVHCIEEITTTDTVSETTYKQSYAYHHGYYDHAEREFRGFGRVDTIDTDTAVIDDDGSDPSERLDQDPVMTKSWYHTGAWMEYELLTERYEDEYFIANDSKELTVSISVPSGLSAKEQREAYRAVKGSQLRQEIYALDGSAKEDIPYAITSFAYCVTKLQSIPADPVSGNGTYPNAVFFNYQEQKLTQSCERFIEDPRIAHEISLEIDEYGNVLQAAQIVYGRNDAPAFLPAEVITAQEKMHLTYSRNNYTNDILNDDLEYRLRLPYESISCELFAPSYVTGSLWLKEDLFLLVDGMSISPYSTAMTGGSAILRKLSHSKTLFRENDAATELPLGDLESLAIPHEQYTLAFSDDIIASPFTDAKLEEGEYIDLDSDDNYWVPSGQVEYGTIPEDDFYSVHEFNDPWGNTTSIEYWDDSADQYWLLPKSTTDAVGNVTTVEAYDWRILQPTEMTDINGNQSEIAYDALGMPVAMAVKGKPTDIPLQGDNLTGLDIEDYIVQEDFWTDPENYAATLLGNATMRCVYDLSVQPTAVAMIGRETHYEPLHGASNLVIRITYTDGFGRVAMHKVQAGDDPITSDPRWVGSGKTVYNNKGKTVLQYEPYFSTTHAYDPADQAANQGVSPRMHYDALGRVERTDMPDGTFSLTKWDGWMQVVYDANDTCTDSEWYTLYSSGTTEQQDAATKASAHYNTPTIMHLDSLARPFYTVQLLEALNITQNDEGLEFDLTGIDHINSYENLDIIGNRLSVVDGRGNTPLTYNYNLLKVPTQQVSIDSGTQYMLADVSGQPLYAWDADDREFHFEYDELRRQISKEVTESSINTILERMEYGEDAPSPEDNNLRGQLHIHWDGAGTVEAVAYDFKGNLLENKRIYIDDATTRPDWTIPVSVTMESDIYTTLSEYDALSRPIHMTTPDNGITDYAYDKGGLLFSVTVRGVVGSSASIVNSIQYDSKGQREKIEYDNGTTTFYEYDAANFRVIRIRTLRPFSSTTLQDLNYWYDPVGNITLQEDAVLDTVFFRNGVATPENDYTYDTLYRLIEAKGREHEGANGAVTASDSDRSKFVPAVASIGDSAKMRRYTQYYEYDEVGNMTKMQHVAFGGTGSWTRNFTIDGASNQLTASSIGSNGSSTDSYTYDNRGNMTGGMNHLNAGGTCMNYNEDNRLETVILTGSLTAYYQYDGSGQRVRKTIVNTSGSITEVRKYIGEWEIYNKFVSSSLTLSRESLHVSDDSGRIALIDTPSPASGDDQQNLRYQYSNHLGTATLELDSIGETISYEEYYPFGSTSYQAGRNLVHISLKRYRYTGKERDEETGLYYHGARYYASWLCRWVASDPINSEIYNWDKDNTRKNQDRDFIELSASSYEYCYDSPTRFVDLTGEQPNLRPTYFSMINNYVGKKLPFKTNGITALDGKKINQSHNSPNTIKVSNTVLDSKNTSKIVLNKEFSESKSWLNEYLSNGEISHEQNPILSVDKVITKYKASLIDLTKSNGGIYLKMELDITKINVKLDNVAFSQKIDSIKLTSEKTEWVMKVTMNEDGTINLPILNLPDKNTKTETNLSISKKLEQDLKLLPNDLAAAVSGAIDTNKEIVSEAIKYENQKMNELDERLNSQQEIKEPIFIPKSLR